MRCLLLIAIFYSLSLPARSQNAENIIAGLRSVNKEVTNSTCSTGNAALISHRGMNVFLAYQTLYLLESGDISFYTNNITLNTAEGRFGAYHNFQKSSGIDEPVKSMFSAGLNVNIANGYAGGFLNKKFENELWATVKYQWLGKVKTRYKGCPQTQNNGNQKQAMDALRASILYSLEIEMNKKEADFKTAVDKIDEADIPGQNINSAKTIAQQTFYEDLKSTSEEKFARLQADALIKTNKYSLISTGWTNLTANIPIAFPTYTIARSLTTVFQEKHPYPFDIMLSHTRMWESSKMGRFFVTLGSKVLLNNSKLSYALGQTNFTGYKISGGTDTVRLAGLKNDPAYIGNYKTFVTPSLTGRLVYFPPGSHLGVSFLLEQNFGSYNLMNSRLGIPFILINSKKIPAINFEFYLLFFDMSNKLAPAIKSNNKIAVGIGVGIALSRLIY